MRDHSTIVREAGIATVAARLGIPSEHTVRAWMSRGRIPPEQWARFKEEGWASLEELAAMVPSRKSAAA